MRTEAREIDGRSFELVIVGGGIQGAALAREAALRGLTTLLVERDDFACGTSSRSSRLVHGGVRYLRQGNVALVREALHERERLLRAAPHLVRPLPMLMPFLSDGGGSPLMLKLGLKLYSWIALKSTLPRSRSLRADDCVRAFPGLRRRGLRGGALFYDAVTRDGPLTIAVLLAAHAAGAVLANHLEVTGCDDRRLRLLDHQSGDEIVVGTRTIINATGPHADRLRRCLGVDGDDLVRQSRGTHLVLPPRSGETALAAFLPDGRIQFVVPHHDGTLCGTTDVAEEAGQSSPSVPAADVEYLFGALSHLLDPAPGRHDALFAYCGWRSLPARPGPPGALHREAFTVEERCAAGSLHTVVGGKLTTHRSFAERALQRLCGGALASPSRHQPLPGGDGPREDGDPLWQRHGSRAAIVRGYARGEPDLLEPICPHRPFLGAEVSYAVRELAAETFVDLALRRLYSLVGPCMQETCLRRLHGIYARSRSEAADFGDDVGALRQAVRQTVGEELGAVEPTLISS